LGFAAVGVWGLICATRLIFAAIGFALTPPTWNTVPGLAVNILENAICGLMAALAIGIILFWGRKPGKLTESFVSALFNGNLAKPDINAVFWGKVVLSGAVGWTVGRVAGGAGIVALPPTIASSGPVLFGSGKVPLVMFIGGGYGGPGGTDFLPLVFLFVVVFLMIVLLAAVAGTLLHLALYGVAGMTKGGVRAYVLALIKPRAEPGSEPDQSTHPVIVGMQRGFIVGVIVGAFDAAFTTWGAATLTH
jgi:hypothetical protein